MGVFIDMYERGKFLNFVFDLYFLGMGLKYLKWVKCFKLIFISNVMREIFMRFMRVSLVRIYFDVN